MISGPIVINATSPAPRGDLRRNRMRPLAGNKQTTNTQLSLSCTRIRNWNLARASLVADESSGVAFSIPTVPGFCQSIYQVVYHQDNISVGIWDLEF